MYGLLFSPSAERYFKKLKDKHLKEKFRTALMLIRENPYIGKPKKGDLSGVYSYDVYYSTTHYEIAYSIYEINEKKVVVLLAGSRENFYKELKRF